MLKTPFVFLFSIAAVASATPPDTARQPAAGEATKSASAEKSGTGLALTGITFTVPASWKAQEIQAGPMAPKAVFHIPEQKAGEGEGVVRITHYPEMKGKDDMNIDRWIGQVANAEGKPATRAEAKIEKIELQNIRVTMVDLSGSVKMTMRDSGKPDHRMIAAIVDHPKGPHFVVAAGPASAMKTWSTDIVAFLKSAKVTKAGH